MTPRSAVTTGDIRRAPASPLLAHAISMLSSRQLQALADQVIVSATGFVVLLMLGRWSDPAEVGTYVIALSLLAMGIAASDALITRPYTIQVRRPVGTPGQHAYSALLLVLALAALSSLLLVAAAVILASTAGAGPAAAALALATLVPFALMREFARRLAFARMTTELALAVDGLVAFLTIGGLALVVVTGQLTAINALLVMATACALVSVGWLITSRSWFQRIGAQTGRVLRQSWELGRWLLVSQVAVQVQGYASYWLSMALLSTAATGIYAATMSVVALANPLLFGFSTC
jgi:O-antigen/teichoic acid export membrane protein